MACSKHVYQTSVLLWSVFSTAIFVALGFLHFAGASVSKGDNRYWARIEMLFSQSSRPSDYDATVALFTVLLILPSAILGWLAQAVTVVLRARSKRIQKEV